jgi:hypothetical protein
MSASGWVLRRHKGERWFLSSIWGHALRNRLLALSTLDTRARYNRLQAEIFHLMRSESGDEEKSYADG